MCDVCIAGIFTSPQTTNRTMSWLGVHIQGLDVVVSSLHKRITSRGALEENSCGVLFFR